MIKAQYKNVNNDVITLFKDFFSELQKKLQGKEDIQLIIDVNKNIHEFPNIPKQDMFVSFSYDQNLYYVTYSERMIELTNYIEDWYEDEQGKKSDYNQIQEYIFRYELDGYIDINGSMDQFRVMLLEALKNVRISEIEISDEE